MKAKLSIAATGHRPERLAPKEICYSRQVRERLRSLARNYLIRAEPDEGVSGLALGWDIGFSLACIDLTIPLIAAVPFKGQENYWSTEDQDLYNSILKQAKEVHIISKGGYSPAKMQTRNIWMADRVSRFAALWDGEKAGGTYNCLQYAESKGVAYNNLWNSWVKYSGVALNATTT